MENQQKDLLVKLIAGLISLLFVIFFLSCLFQLLWNNCLVGLIDGFNPISFWQSYGLLLMLYLSGRIFIMDFGQKN